MKPARLLQFLPAFWCLAAPALAAPKSPFPVRLGSHVLAVHGRALLLDGKRVTGDANRFDLELAATVDGVPVAAVYADRGGASCENGTMLMFAAPPTGPVVQGSVDGTTCQARLKTSLANGQVVVVDPPVAAKPTDVTPAVAGSPGAVWLFDARHGAARATGIGEEGPDQE